MLDLFPDEKIITQSNGGIVTLTSHRICYEQKEWSQSYNQNIMLEHITSCENKSTSNVWILIIGTISIIIAFASTNPKDAISFVFILALLSFLLYRASRRSEIIISSPSTKMKINVKEMRREQVLNFINMVEQTKHRRIISLNNRSIVTNS